MRRSVLLCALIALAACARPAAGQVSEAGRASDQDRTRGRRMLRQLRQTLERNYYDSTFHGVDLGTHTARTDSAIERATSVPEITAALAEYLHALDDSHTFFLPPGLTVSVDYGWTWQIVGDDCFVVDVKEQSDAETQGLKRGDRVLAIDGIRPARANVDLIGYVYFALSPRPGMRLVVEREGGERAELTIKSEMKRRERVRNYADLDMWRFYREQARRAQRPRRWFRSFDSVLVWRLPAFVYQDENLDRMMGRAREHRWLILDLRGNSGGSSEAIVRLLGHFVDRPFHAFSEVWRDSTAAQRVKPRGKAPYRGETVVLVDSESASASEITSRVLQMRGRATVVGDRSAGAVMGAYRLPLQLGSAFQERVLDFGISVTVVDIVMPDSSRLERVGVIPNVAALPTGADLAAKRDPAMQFALELAGVRMTAEEAAKILR